MFHFDSFQVVSVLFRWVYLNITFSFMQRFV
nr:MAG TPA: hypothetical protein [Caudoviricetes sp.]